MYIDETLEIFKSVKSVYYFSLISTDLLSVEILKLSEENIDMF